MTYMAINVLRKVQMPKLDLKARCTGFSEVAKGYSAVQAVAEAGRCIECKNSPCKSGCPVNIKIPEFIHLVKEGNFEGAYRKIAEDSGLPAICGRVCPQEDQCEKLCIRGIKGDPVSIGALERFVADRHIQTGGNIVPAATKIGKKVAVVGAGPAGLTCAADLAKSGFDVTVFEALHKPGGVLIYGIPEFRLPKLLVAKEIDNLKALGVEFKLNVFVGRSITLEDLEREGYAAVFIGSGAGLPSFMDIEGEELIGVYSANEFLTRSNLMKAYDPNFPTPIKRKGRVCVIGGGNVAMDAARTALRLGADTVTIVYRRGKEEIPARYEEVENAEEEGIEFHLLTAPLKVEGEGGKVTGLFCQKMTLGEPDASGRRRPVPQKDTEFSIPCDTVIVAIGQTPNPIVKSLGVETKDWGGIVVDENTMKTSRAGVYAGGDAVSGAATVILAMGMGKTAAKSIIKAAGRK